MNKLFSYRILFVCVIFVLLLVSLLFVGVGAFADEVNPYEGYTAIGTVEQLLSISENLNGNYYLANDIAFTAEHAYIVNGIGGNESTFNGILDGRGHSIVGIKLQEEVFYNYGSALFYNLGINSVVKDVVFDSVQISDVETIQKAAILAVNAYGTISDITIKNLVIDMEGLGFSGVAATLHSGSITNVTLQNLDFNNCSSLAGIVSEMTGGSIQGVTISGFSSLTDSGTVSIAGIVNTMSSGTIQDVEIRNLSLIGTQKSGSYLGGVVAYMSGGTISDIDIRGTSENHIILSKADGLGGVVSKTTDNCSITNAYVSYCDISYGYRAGGIAGLMAGEVTFSTVHNVSIKESRAIGGISGWTGLEADDTKNGVIKDCYVYDNELEVVGPQPYRKGAISGSFGIISDCYAIDNSIVARGAKVEAEVSNDGLTNLTDIEARAYLSLLMNKNATNWQINANIEGGYPFIDSDYVTLTEYQESKSSASYHVTASEDSSVAVQHFGSLSAKAGDLAYQSFKFYYEGRDGTEYSLTETAPCNIGDYTFYAVALDTISSEQGDIQVSGSYSYSFSIVKIGYENVLKLNGYQIIYDGGTHNVEVSLIDDKTPDSFFDVEGVNDEDLPTYYYYVIDDEKGLYIEREEIRDAGKYRVEVIIPDAPNFKETKLTCYVDIDKKALTVSVDDINIIYGNLAGAMNISYDGFVSNEDMNALSKLPTAYTDEQHDLTTIWDVGNYENILKVQGGTAKNYSLEYVFGDFTVENATFEDITFEDKTTVYNEEEQVLSIEGEVPPNSEVSYVYSGEQPTDVFKRKNVGNYTVEVRITNPNYNEYRKTVNFIITKADLIGVAFETYPAYVYDGESVYKAFINQQTLPPYLKEMPLESFISYTGNDGVTNVGKHRVVASIDGLDNYNDIVLTTFIEIIPLQLSITAPNLTSRYADAILPVNLTFNYSLNGNEVQFIENSQSIPIALQNLVFSSEIDWVDVNNASVSPIKINYSVNDNYSVNVFRGSYTITKATLTAKVKDCLVTYGDSLSTEIEYDGFLAGDTLESISLLEDTVLPQLEDMPPQTADAGYYTVRATSGSSKNYVFLCIGGTITIIKAQIIGITFNNEELVFDGQPHSLQVVLPEQLTDLEVSYSKSQLVDAGVYEIIAHVEEQTNYRAWSQSAKLTINRKAITITAPTINAIYGEEFYASQYLYTIYDIDRSEIEVEEIASALTCQINGQNACYSPVATYPITFDKDFSEYTNYTVSVEDGTYNITKATLTIKAVDRVFTYGEDIIIPVSERLEYSGFVGNDNQENMNEWLVGAINVAIPSSNVDAGVHPITFDTKATAANYNITYIDGSVTLNKISLLSLSNFKYEDKTVEYNGELHTIVIIEEGGNGILSGISHSYSGGNQRNVGVYEVEVTIKNNKNYLDETGKATLTITPVALTVSGLSAVNKQYDGTTDIQILGGTVSGLVGGDDVSSVTVSASGVTPLADASDTPYPVTLNIAFVGTNAKNYVVDEQKLQAVEVMINKKKVSIVGEVKGKNRPYSLDKSKTVGLDFSDAQLFYYEEALPVDSSKLQFSSTSNAQASDFFGNNLLLSEIKIYLSGEAAGNYELDYKLSEVHVDITKQSIFKYSCMGESLDTYFGAGNWSEEGEVLTLTFSDYVYKNGEYSLDIFSEGILDLLGMSMDGVSVTYDGDSTATLAGNYTAYCDIDGGAHFSNERKQIRWSIAPYEIVIDSVYAKDKPYDGTATGVNGYQLDYQTITTDDQITLEGSCVFNNTTQGSSTSVITLSIVGDRAANYVIKNGVKNAEGEFVLQSTQPSTIIKRDITPQSIVVTSKAYDASTAIVISGGEIVDDVALTDGVSFEIYASAVADSNTVGQNKPLDVSNAIRLTALNASILENYNLVYPQLTCEITQRELTLVNVTVQNRQYDGTKKVKLLNGELQGIIQGDDVVLELLMGDITDMVVGSYNAVALTNESYSLGGAHAINYSVKLPQASQQSVQIERRKIAITGITATERPYNATANVSLTGGQITDELAIADGITFSLNGGVMESANVGVNKTTASISILGDLRDNYIAEEIVDATITPKELIIKANNFTIKEGKSLPVFSYTIEGLEEGDTINGALATETDGKLKGTYAITIGTLSASDNYNVIFTEGVLTVKDILVGWILLGIFGGFAFIFVCYVLIATIQGKSVKLELRKLFRRDKKEEYKTREIKSDVDKDDL